jgi:riboflavin kinase/FMN adenylyltransferase
MRDSRNSIRLSYSESFSDPRVHPVIVPDLPFPIVFTPRGQRPFVPARSAVSVGNFDGVHLGHAALVRRLVQVAGRLGVPAVALTFDPHPASIVRPEAAPVPLTTPARRAELLLALGLDQVLVQPADRGLLARSAEAFYREVLRERLEAAAIVEGSDFRFGAGRAGDIDLLRGYCGHDGVILDVVEPVVSDGSPVSSSRIRALLAVGDVAAANPLLTAPFRLSGTVVIGARRGAALGFPTANLADIVTLVPGNGVYAARARVRWPEQAEQGLNDWHAAAVHVGPNVTFGATNTTVEAHLVGFRGDCYAATLDIDFLRRLRDTWKFPSVEALRTQLAADVAEATHIAAALPPAAPSQTLDQP